MTDHEPTIDLGDAEPISLGLALRHANTALDDSGIHLDHRQRTRFQARWCELMHLAHNEPYIGGIS